VRGNPIFAPEATSTGHPVRRTSPPAHEATSTGHPVRQKVTFAHETDEYDGRCAGRTLSRTENHSKGRQSIGRWTWLSGRWVCRNVVTSTGSVPYM